MINIIGLYDVLSVAHRLLNPLIGLRTRFFSAGELQERYKAISQLKQ